VSIPSALKICLVLLCSPIASIEEFRGILDIDFTKRDSNSAKSSSESFSLRNPTTIQEGQGLNGVHSVECSLKND